MQRRTMKTEVELLDDAVDQLQRHGVFPLVFGGFTTSSGLRVMAVRGHRTPHLATLHVAMNRGLGGRALAERQPRLTSDYRTSRVITHDYDREVLGEGVRTLLAVPLLVAGEVRGVLYGASRDDAVVGGVAVEPVVAAAGSLQRLLQLRDAASESTASVASSALDAAQLERLRAGFAELRSITAEVDDPTLAARLRSLERQLAGVGGADAATSDVRLAPRELDVLGWVALGMRNAEVAAQLGLTESTVKSYLGTAMQKLGERSRHAAVREARRLGLLP